MHAGRRNDVHIYDIVLRRGSMLLSGCGAKWQNAHQIALYVYAKWDAVLLMNMILMKPRGNARIWMLHVLCYRN